MRPGPISRRSLVVGGAAALAAVSLPVDVVEAVTAGTSSTVDPGALPVVFDPRAFMDDLLSTRHRVALHQPVRVTGEPDEDLRPYFWIYPRPDGGFNRAYSEVMTRWADRLDATPDHVERVVAHLRERAGAST